GTPRAAKPLSSVTVTRPEDGRRSALVQVSAALRCSSGSGVTGARRVPLSSRRGRRCWERRRSSRSGRPAERFRSGAEAARARRLRASAFWAAVQRAFFLGGTGGSSLSWGKASPHGVCTGDTEGRAVSASFSGGDVLV